MTVDINIEAALQAVQEGTTLIAERKQKVRIADSSKAGWGTVSHLDKTNVDKLTAEQQNRFSSQRKLL